MLARQIRLLIQTKALLEKGHTASDIAKELRQHPFVCKKLVEQAKGFQQAELKAALKKAQESDMLIKTGKLEDRLVIENFILSLK